MAPSPGGQNVRPAIQTVTTTLTGAARNANAQRSMFNMFTLINQQVWMAVFSIPSLIPLSLYNVNQLDCTTPNLQRPRCSTHRIFAASGGCRWRSIICMFLLHPVVSSLTLPKQREIVSQPSSQPLVPDLVKEQSLAKSTSDPAPGEASVRSFGIRSSGL